MQRGSFYPSSCEPAIATVLQKLRDSKKHRYGENYSRWERLEMTAGKLNVEQREKLFKDHEKLIEKMAKKFFRYGKIGVEYDDLYQDAGLGLHIATLDFNPGLGKNQGFEKYAVIRMYQVMVRNFYHQGNLLTTSFNVIETASKIKKNDMIEWEPTEIAKQLDKTLSTVERALKHLNGTPSFSLNAEVNSSEGERPVSDLVADSNAVDFDYIVTNRMFFETLSEREKTVFELMLQEKRQKEMMGILNLSSTSISNATCKIRAKYRKFTKVVV